MINEQYKYSELTGKIIGCAMEVHRQLGNGFQEVIYQRALEIDMAMQGIAFSREHEMEIFYKGENIGTRRVDFLVEGVVSVELKALIQLEAASKIAKSHPEQANVFCERVEGCSAFRIPRAESLNAGLRLVPITTQLELAQHDIIFGFYENPFLRQFIEDVHLAQAINYHLEVGLLVNFGAKSLQFKRVANANFKQLNQRNQ